MGDASRPCRLSRIPTPEPEPRHPREDGLRRGYKWSTNLPSPVMSDVLAAKELRGRNMVSDVARSNIAIDNARSTSGARRCAVIVQNLRLLGQTIKAGFARS